LHVAQSGVDVLIGEYRTCRVFKGAFVFLTKPAVAEGLPPLGQERGRDPRAVAGQDLDTFPAAQAADAAVAPNVWFCDQSRVSVEGKEGGKDD
jgi:hypothetical protein